MVRVIIGFRWGKLPAWLFPNAGVRPIYIHRDDVLQAELAIRTALARLPQEVQDAFVFEVKR